jgi:hypothetical protein
MCSIRISAETSAFLIHGFLNFPQSVKANIYVESEVVSLVNSVPVMFFVSAYCHDRCLVTAFSRGNTQLSLSPLLLCCECHCRGSYCRKRKSTSASRIGSHVPPVRRAANYQLTDVSYEIVLLRTDVLTEVSLMRYDVMQLGRQVPTFRRKLREDQNINTNLLISMSFVYDTVSS